MGPLEINVSDLRRSHSADREVTLEATVEWSVELSRLEPAEPGKSNMFVEATLSPVGGGLMVQGLAEFTARHACHRCLTEWSEPMSVPVSALFSPRSNDDEGTFLLTDVIDLEPAVRDDVLLAMPLLPTCPGGCTPQLVGDGETGLNTPGPGGSSPADDVPDAPDDEGSPFSILKDLFPDELQERGNDGGT